MVTNMAGEDSSAAPGGKKLPDKVAKILGNYRKLLLKEMVFLRDSGGRKYKVTNGRYICKSGSGFAYCFDLEAELFLAEDSPLTLTVEQESHKGSVLVCEEFQIIVVLESNIGRSISSAFISVEPWKLLDSLGNRLSAITPKNGLTVKLMSEGPLLATKDPIGSVEKGQDAAKRHALEEPITVIWGPPGTGKTHCMAEIAIELLSQGKSVLVVSHSNVSVDGVVAKVAELMRGRGMEEPLKGGKVLRFGHIRDEALARDECVSSYNYAARRSGQSMERLREIQGELDEMRRRGDYASKRRVAIQEEIRKIRRAIVEEEKGCVARAKIVGTTISKVYANPFFEGRSYDAVMFDEVSMAFVPQVVCASMHARERLVLVGDFRQLPPIVQSKDGRMLSRDIFWYLGICDAGQSAHFHPWLVMLDEQRRMHPQISAFPARAFYGGLLRDHESVARSRDAIAEAMPFPGSAMGLVDLSGTYCTAGRNSDHSRYNILSAAVSFACALTAEASGGCSAGVISPYKAQCRLVRAMVEDCRAKRRPTGIACSTVHQFQGSERDVVVIDAVESCPSKSLGVLTSNNENGAVDRLVNVAATRARGKLVTVANGRFWELKAPETGCAFADLVSHHREFDDVASVRGGGLRELLAGLDFGPNIELFDEMRDAVDALDDDILQSSHRIVISVPDGKLDEPFAAKVLKALSSARARGVEVLLKCLNWDELPADWRRLGWQSEDAVCPMLLIDDRVVWHGMPPARGQLVDKKGKGFLAVLKTPLRITGKNTVEMIKSLTDAEGRVVDGQRTALQAQTGRGAAEHGGCAAAGFARYVQENMRCRECKAPMRLERGYNSKKFFARCSACKTTSLIDVNFLNHYICVKQARCPKCRGYLTARVSTYGLYIKCDNGHTVRPDEI